MTMGEQGKRDRIPETCPRCGGYVSIWSPTDGHLVTVPCSTQTEPPKEQLRLDNIADLERQVAELTEQLRLTRSHHGVPLAEFEDLENKFRIRGEILEAAIEQRDSYQRRYMLFGRRVAETEAQLAARDALIERLRDAIQGMLAANDDGPHIDPSKVSREVLREDIKRFSERFEAGYQGLRAALADAQQATGQAQAPAEGGPGPIGGGGAAGC